MLSKVMERGVNGRTIPFLAWLSPAVNTDEDAFGYIAVFPAFVQTTVSSNQ